MNEEELNKSIISEEIEKDKELSTKRKTLSNSSKKHINSTNLDINKKSKHKNSNEIRISLRFSGQDDVALYSRWKKKIEGEGISSYSALNQLVKSELLKREQDVVVKSVKNELFYALRKAIWASLQPMTLNMKNEMNKLKIEQVIISQKLNLVLNVLCKNDAFEQQLVEPSNEYLKEIPYFNDVARTYLIDKEKVFSQKLLDKLNKNEESIDKFLAQLSDNEYDEYLENHIASKIEE